ncbi:hypothetical protein Anapl_17119 [Anas platyrhynchos]|uniref:Uncharacterized protein n=1 Tax=Anas platyrhynchos TaxID=8839 RepID=R0JMW8_ANAPL|nr:hypothetical protein Anapl_17119 [Anas platyrhynchos]
MRYCYKKKDDFEHAQRRTFGEQQSDADVIDSEFIDGEQFKYVIYQSISSEKIKVSPVDEFSFSEQCWQVAALRATPHNALMHYVMPDIYSERIVQRQCEPFSDKNYDGACRTESLAKECRENSEWKQFKE